MERCVKCGTELRKKSKTGCCYPCAIHLTAVENPNKIVDETTRKIISQRTREAMKKPAVKAKLGWGKGISRNTGKENPYWKGGKKSYCHKMAKKYFALMGAGMQSISKYGEVHHLDRDITNNLSDNLMLISISDHTKLHSLEDGKGR